MIDMNKFMPIKGHFASPTSIGLHPGFMDGKSRSSNLRLHANTPLTDYLTSFVNMPVLMFGFRNHALFWVSVRIESLYIVAS